MICRMALAPFEIAGKCELPQGPMEARPKGMRRGLTKDSPLPDTRADRNQGWLKRCEVVATPGPGPPTALVSESGEEDIQV